MKKAFTMIELVFVIVILGILASVAIPKLGSTKDNADLMKGRTDVATIRSSILTERQSQLIKGNNSFIEELSNDSSLLFMKNKDENRFLLTYGIASGTSSGKWSADDDDYKKYSFHTNNLSVKFTYDNNTGKFYCDRDDDDTGKICRKLVD